MSKDEIAKSALVLEPEKVILVLGVHLDAQAHAQDEAGHGGDEAREEGVERERAHQSAVGELEDAGEKDVHQVGIDRLQSLRGGLVVLHQKGLCNLDRAGHVAGNLLKWAPLFGYKMHTHQRMRRSTIKDKR